MATTNTTITTGGTAQNILSADMLRASVEITAVDEDTWVNFGTDAAVNTGELVQAGQTKSWLRKFRDEVTQRVSVVAATTGSRVIAGAGTASGE
jgi:hypothetical protein